MQVTLVAIGDDMDAANAVASATVAADEIAVADTAAAEAEVDGGEWRHHRME